MSQGFIGERLGSFRLEEVLGSGAMGVVFRATHETTGRQAAVKIVHGELAQKGKVFDRFQREAEILKQFRHPNIVRWLAWGRFKGTSYFAMEYVEGITLEKILQDRGELPWREVLGLGLQLCSALQYAHDQGVVHRDLKPSNIMVTLDGKLKLTDFGIAKDLDATTLTAPGRTLGTAAYMAPEQIRGTPAVSHKTDLYSLGVLFYQMLTGKPPFDGSSAVVLMHCHLNEPPPRPGDKVQDLPRELDDLVVKLMAKAPADRPWDAAIVEQVFKDLDDRAQRGDAIDMVWPSAGSPAANPSRAGVGVTETRARKKGRKSSTWGGLSSGFATRDPDGRLVSSRLLSRGTLEVVGLVVALVAIGGFIGYWVWPPSAQYLYRQAEALMASQRRSDRITARDEFLDPLDQRYPDHPYREQTRKWRDEIMLEDAEGRAKTLSSAVKIPGLTDPTSNAERQYVSFDVQAAKAASEGNELMAAMYWKEMAKVLKADDPDERPWHLLAQKRASELETRIRERRAFVVEQLQRADAAFQAGRPTESLAIRSMLVEKYGRYSDLSDLLGGSPGAQPPESGHPNDSPESVPVPASPPASSPAHTVVPDQEPRSTLPPSTKPPSNQ
jgi:serine/threonine protein kinase